MSDISIGVVTVILMLVALLARVPIAIAMAGAALGGTVALQGWDAALFQLGAAPYAATNYGLSVVPMFVLMGAFASRAGLSRALFEGANALVGHTRGGLANATLLGCAGFATICGSSLATAATLGGVALKEMQRYGYDNRLAGGAVAAGGTIGILIPPSVVFVIYGILTEQSIGALFAAGLIPGIIMTAAFMAVVVIWGMINPAVAPKPAPMPWSDRLAAIIGIWPVVGLFVLVIGGIYTGLFTPTEAAGIGAFGALVLAIRAGLRWQGFVESLVETAVTTAMIFLIVIGSMLLSTFLSTTGIPQALRDGAEAWALSPYAILVVILLIYAVLGCLMDSIGMVLLTVPVVYPLIVDAGFDPIWFGVILVIVVELGLITPPVGMNVFIVRGVAPHISTAQAFAGVTPFIFAMVATVVLLILFPSLALWLPKILY